MGIGLKLTETRMDLSPAKSSRLDLGGKLSTRFRRENGPLGSSSERRVLVGNFPEPERSPELLFGWIGAARFAMFPSMAVEHLFTQALGLASPWKVITCDFDPVAKTLELVIDFERGARFSDPETISTGRTPRSTLIRSCPGAVARGCSHS